MKKSILLCCCIVMYVYGSGFQQTAEDASNSPLQTIINKDGTIKKVANGSFNATLFPSNIKINN